MESAVATTYELDDPQKAADELIASIKEQLELKGNSVGILLCDADADGAAITERIKGELGVTVAGMTTLATFDPEGHHEGATVLTVLTANDVTFATAVSQPLGEDYEQQIIAAYQATVPAGRGAGTGAGIGDRPALVLAFCPNGEHFSGDKYPDVLSPVVGNAPIMGGVCSDDYDYERARVFLGGAEYKDSLVIVTLWGAARPLFSIRHVTSQFAERIRRVVHARDNVVFTVGDETFVEYLEGFGLNIDVEDPLLAFTSYPMMLTREDKDEVPLMRHILSLDHETGAGTFVGDVPTGTLANICLVNRNDLKVSARESMEALVRLMGEHTKDGYEYSTVLCISCCGRAIILGSDSDAEGEAISELLPAGLSLTGAYCLGEICPSRYVDGEAVNRFHNCSITFCAF
ncbi:MAG: FIST C-terminal domain-containing protein [Coriobacteriales bacterium]|jgi:hypothetical protein|nr:FIST C-terminal domain-containing protein [Coriobacteriales bacterium]